jgi:hypothetical protein
LWRVVWELTPRRRKGRSLLFCDPTLPSLSTVVVASFGYRQRMHGNYGSLRWRKVREFAEIVCRNRTGRGMSQMGALAAGHLARAHRIWDEDK